MTALTVAVWQRQPEIVAELLKHDANVNLADKEGMTALMWAVIGGHEDCFKHVLERGADINAKARDGKTALDFAIRDRKRVLEAHLRKAGGSSGK